MNQELTKKETAEVSRYDPETLQKAKELSGEGGYGNIPFIPRIRINNKTEKKMVDIDGKQKEVKVLPEAGFLITRKDGDEYIESLYGPTLAGGVLKERYQIESVYEVEPAYKSDEFDTFNGIIRVYNNKNRQEVIGEGTYQELRELFATGEKNTAGRPKVSFRTSVILYIDDGKEIVRFKWRLGGNNNWFDYKNKFGAGDTYVAYKTHFELAKDTTGDNEYWYATARMGEPLNLAEQLKKQMEIQKFFIVVRAVTDAKGKSDYEVLPAEPVREVKEEIDDEFKDKIAQIPF